MSLINDALKRASTQKAAAAAPPSYGAPLHATVESARGTGPLPIILCIVGIGALLMAGGFWLKSKGTPPMDARPPSAARSAAPIASPTPVIATVEPTGDAREAIQNPLQ